jgi:hypothetical protein
VNICTTSDLQEEKINNGLSDENPNKFKKKVMTLSYATLCAIYEIGGGYTNLKKFMSILHIPFLGSSKYEKIKKVLNKDLIALAQKNIIGKNI